MKILMLVNWKVQYCEQASTQLLAADYCLKGTPYWFFRYFRNSPQVDVVDIHSFGILERFEKNVLHFYLIQTLRVLPKLGRYDLVISHGMQSGIVMCLWRRFFKTKARHVVFDIGSFNSAAESGAELKLMQWASRSLDGLIYHTLSQKKYYEKCFPWSLNKSYFIRFGCDADFFLSREPNSKRKRKENRYILCVGSEARDLETLTKAYAELETDVELCIIGEERPSDQKGVTCRGRCSIQELNSLIAQAEFCILPLFDRNFSYGQMTLQQQMAFGKCVLTARVPSMVDYIRENDTAVAYTPRDVEDCRSKMKLLLDNPRLTESIGQNARRFIAEACNEKIMAGEIEKVLQKLSGGHGK